MACNSGTQFSQEVYAIRVLQAITVIKNTSTMRVNSFNE